MKDSVPLLQPVKHRRKRSHSSESDSSQTSSDSDDSVRISKVPKRSSPERIEISSDSDASLVEKRNCRKKKKHKHSDVENINVIHDGHTGKRHRHKCHHHHHRHAHAHGHHRHHRLDSCREREEKVHRKTCSKHKMAHNNVRVKERPGSEDDERTRQSHSSHRRIEKRRDRSDDEISR